MEDGKIKVWFPTVRVGTGTDIFTTRLARALQQKGLIAKITWFPPCFEQFAPLLRFASLPANTDIIFTNSWNGFAFKRDGIPLVVTVHHGGFDPALDRSKTIAQHLYHKMLIRPYEKRSFRHADAITAVSSFVATTIRPHVATLEKIAVIHNWIDTERFRPADTAQPASSKFRLLYVGKLSRMKGVDLLPDIMEQLGDGFELRIAGRAQDRILGELPTNVRWLGWLDEEKLVRAYQECDALLAPSRSEGFGYSALEAMACGKPVIATNGTALQEVIEHGISGLLCPENDIAAFVDACRHLASDTQCTINMGQSARHRAVNYFTEAKTISRYISLIDSLKNH